MGKTSAPQYTVLVEKNVPASMRDGVLLYADVYHPAGGGRFPVLVMRLPYDKNLPRRRGDVDYFVERGYVVVVQDTRGRYASEGDFYPLIYESEDGYDTIEWAAVLPWSDGNVGTLGQSYLGATQYLMAPTRPPHLRCQFPTSAAADFHQCWVYHTGGAFELGWQVPYAIFMARDSIARRGLTASLLPTLEADLVDAPTHFAKPLSDAAYRRLPLVSWADTLQPVARYLDDYLRHPEYGPYWWSINIDRQHRHITTPMYHLSSWYDIFVHGVLANFSGIREQGMNDIARKSQKLLVGPWAHLFPYTNPTSEGTGEADFGPAALIDVHAIQLRWFDHFLKGINSGILEEPPVTIFVMGENTWRDEHEWPLARTRYTPYYLHSGGNANTLAGDGALGLHLPREEPPDRYLYDPNNPVPTRGGATLIIPMGVYDQRPVEERPDVLVYTSAAIETPLEVTGPLQVTLYASSTSRDTDFAAKLIDVRSDGYATNLADGIIRARYRHSRERATLLNPSDVTTFTIDLWATSHVFLPGHRIRLEITSSNFPRFDRNLNTGDDLATATRLETALQTVFHDQRYPSHVLLPVIPR